MSESWRQEYHGPGTRLSVRCGRGRCLLEFAQELNGGLALGPANVEILLQPRDDRGLPQGSPAVLCDLEIPLHARTDGAAAGHRWLPPSLGADLIRRCHFRLAAR